MSRYRAAYLDPDGTRHAGLPTYPWGLAPAGLATRRQLTGLGLCPGGQPIAAQVLWRQYRRDAPAYLYRTDLAKPKRTASPAQLVALAKALRARRMCPDCRRDAGYVIPTRYGTCLDCLERTQAA